MLERIFTAVKHTAAQFSADVYKSLPLNYRIKTDNQKQVPKLKKQYFATGNLNLIQA